jgi:hypothetical protein
MNNSGLIDYTVFIAASLEMQGLISRNHLDDAFCWLDADRSGSISKKVSHTFICFFLNIFLGLLNITIH